MQLEKFLASLLDLVATIPGTQIAKLEKMNLPGCLALLGFTNLAVLAGSHFISRIVGVELKYRLQYSNCFDLIVVLVGALVVSQCSAKFLIRTVTIFVCGMVVSVLSSSATQLETFRWPDTQMLYEDARVYPFVAFVSSFIFWRFADLLRVRLVESDGSLLANRLSLAEMLLTTLIICVFFAGERINQVENAHAAYVLQLRLQELAIACAVFAGFVSIAFYCGRSTWLLCGIAIFTATAIAVQLYSPSRFAYIFFTITSFLFYLTLNQFVFCRLIHRLLPSKQAEFV